MPCGRYSADEQARSTAAEAVRVLAATSGPVPLVLTVPTPGRWLVAAAQQAGSDPGPPDAAQAETAAIYSADFLRMFADTGVDGLLLDEGRVPAGELIHPEAYRPVLNVADYYQWPVFIQTDAAAAWPHGPASQPGRAAIGTRPPYLVRRGGLRPGQAARRRRRAVGFAGRAELVLRQDRRDVPLQRGPSRPRGPVRPADRR